MLTIENDATIRHAIWRRLVAEPGVTLHKFDDIGIRLKTQPVRPGSAKKRPGAIQIQVTAYVQPIPGLETGEVLKITSGITAPLQFDLRRLFNEIDEVAEAIKAARRKHLGKSVNILNDDVQLAGNG